ncbi:type II toxin-antitoxin system RelE family toxin [Salinisphaera japonica]|uniref:Translation repressor RelE n=1 Tax=Salinisphaera japonica YTM-1 TaxID=1209778 RepID=A0A423PZ61_9GAMM|nr:type II toxin-antitoxin system RelE/ParE family toxin [Salinisphaera japonica]ROO30830.1 translation repressor RelE [Salinisphaera japonica YTM-1]
MNWTIEYARSVTKAVRKMDPPTRQRIKDFLEHRVAALTDPREIGDPLKGELAGLWRYRVGDYRIICEIREETLIVLVVRIGHRRAVYR